MLKLQVLLNVLVIQFVDVILSVDVIKYVLVKVDSVLAIQKQYQVADVTKYVSVMVHIADVINRV